jgi:hypothetical protein
MKNMPRPQAFAINAQEACGGKLAVQYKAYARVTLSKL